MFLPVLHACLLTCRGGGAGTGSAWQGERTAQQQGQGVSSWSLMMEQASCC